MEAHVEFEVVTLNGRSLNEFWCQLARRIDIEVMLPASLNAFKRSNKFPVLRSVANPVVDVASAESHALYDQLMRTLVLPPPFPLSPLSTADCAEWIVCKQRLKKGMGLAAPQVGVSKRVFVLQRKLFNDMPSSSKNWVWVPPPVPKTPKPAAAPLPTSSNTDSVVASIVSAEPSAPAAAARAAPAQPISRAELEEEYAVVINPVIEAVSQQTDLLWESCLSVPK